MNAYLSYDDENVALVSLFGEDEFVRARTIGTFSYIGGFVTFLTVMHYLGIALLASASWRIQRKCVSIVFDRGDAWCDVHHGISNSILRTSPHSAGVALDLGSSKEWNATARQNSVLITLVFLIVVFLRQKQSMPTESLGNSR